MKEKNSRESGFLMPGEFEPHEGCIMIWPERPGSWRNGAREARRAFRDVIAAIAESEHVYVAVSEASMPSAKELLCGKEQWQKNVTLFMAETDDAWARDVAPTFVRKEDGKNPPQICAVNWEFNAWGGTVDGLYASWENDNAFAGFFADSFGYELIDAAPFVLEGGSVHSDGEGTVLVTEACLLSAEIGRAHV